ncbi:MAG: hypothetical protein AAF441_10785 [Pseudomonadota bacterium]
MTQFGNRQQFGQRSEQRFDASGPAAAGDNKSLIFFHSKAVMFWGAMVCYTVIALLAVIYPGKFFNMSLWQVGVFYVSAVAITLFLLWKGEFDDKPESDIRAFFLGGPWFLLGAGAGFVVFFWQNGFEWLTAYDLTDTNMYGGWTSVHDAEEPKGLMGFLGQLTGCITYGLAGGALTKVVAQKTGLDETA